MEQNLFVMNQAYGNLRSTKQKDWWLFSVNQMDDRDLRNTYGRTVIRILNSGIVPDYDDPEEKSVMFGAAGSGVWCKLPEGNNLAENDDDMTFITNAHVIDNAANLFINHPEWGNLKLKAEAVGGYRDGDKALIVVRGIRKTIEFLKNKQNKSANDLEMWFENVTRLGPLPIPSREMLYDIVDTKCFVVGFPLNQANQVITRGYVSSIQLFDTGSHGQMLLFQTDAAMNHGNSGGALIVSLGKGENTRFFYAGIPSMGIPDAENTGYVLPFHHVESTIYAFTKHQKSILQNEQKGVFLNCERPYLGFNAVFQQEEQPGYRVVQIDQNGCPFELLETNDLIVKVGDAEVQSDGMLRLAWTDLRVPFTTAFDELDLAQESVAMTIVRKNQTIKVEGEWKFDVNLPIRRLYGGIEPFRYESFGGIVISELNLDQAEEIPKLNVFTVRRNRLQPVLAVVAVDPIVNTPVQRGWLVTSVNGQQVETYKQWQKLLLASVEENSISITFNTLQGVSATQNITDLEQVIEKTIQISKIRNERVTDGVEQVRFKKVLEACESLQTSSSSMDFEAVASLN